MGPKIIGQLLNTGLIKDASDIFTLKHGDLQPTRALAEKSADNLIKAIEKAKQITLSKFLFALGIRNVGEETAILLAQKITNNKQLTTDNFIKSVQNLTIAELTTMDGFGGVVAESIYQYFHEKKNINFLEKLFKNGINLRIASHKSPVVSRLLGKSFVLTGTLESMSRDQAKEDIRSLGGNISGSVSKNTDYVIVGKDPGSKYDKALKLGVKILNEKEFLKLLK